MQVQIWFGVRWSAVHINKQSYIMIIEFNQFNSNQMFDNSEEEPQPCVMCGQNHEQMLMLSCIHDPCINCAAVQYVENQPLNSNTYTCAKCGQETELDNSSVVELQKVYHLVKGKKKYDYRKNVNSSAGSIKDKNNDIRPVPSRKYQEAVHRPRQYDLPTQESKYTPPPPASQPTYNSNPKKSYSLAYPCPDHAQEQLTYFCFTCHKPICPECAIHGFHKDHEVQTTRKAIKQIKSLLNEDKQKLDREAKLLLSQKDKHKKLFKEYNDENKKDQDYIRQKMAHLKQIIAQKQKQLLKSVDLTFERNCELMKMENGITDKTIEQINNCKRNIDNTVKKEDLAVLQEFNKRDEQVNKILQKLDIEKEKHYDYQAKNPQKFIDYNLFEEDYDRLLADIHAVKLSSVDTKYKE